ncbi:hypothetical protein L1987_05940 [Smallanthus sonchifolius]|uniref:Uncharacterized protein n=1 Tax=Smallanthus sonchifolius TaxID=185202 RepID=A0ACB9JWX9_9ASTR|nr:hypothetical protein L1987_05940 [Smallanthus sonchifolius]
MPGQGDSPMPQPLQGIAIEDEPPHVEQFLSPNLIFSRLSLHELIIISEQDHLTIIIIALDHQYRASSRPSSAYPSPNCRTPG